MTKELKIERINGLLDMIQALKPTEFSYDYFVSEFNQENNCGTVCCLAGWMPKFFPESHLIWKYSEYWESYTLRVNLTTGPSEIRVIGALRAWFGLPMDIIGFIFFGREGLIHSPFHKIEAPSCVSSWNQAEEHYYLLQLKTGPTLEDMGEVVLFIRELIQKDVI